MNAQFSETDFNIFQNQLLSLRESNCLLDDKCKKQERELNQFKERFLNLEKDLNKANQIISKSKNAKNCENLLDEINTLQLKLQTQEDDFRFQNQELMHQLSELMTTNEMLELKNNQLLTSSTPANKDLSDSSTNDLRRLQAENMALQTSLNIYKEENNISQNLNKSSNNNINSKDLLNDLDKVDNIHSNHNLVEDLQFKLNTEFAENELLKNQLTVLQADKLTVEVELKNFKEKLKKKQESMLQLQNDKDGLYEKMSKELEDYKLSKELEISHLNSQIKELNQDLSLFEMKHKELAEASKEKICRLEENLIDASSRSRVDQEEAVASMKSRLTDQEFNKSQLEEQLREETSKNESQIVKISELEASLAALKEQNYDLQHDRDKQISSLQEMTRLAESRKSALDKLSVDQQDKMHAAQDKLHQSNLKFNEKISNLESERDALKASILELRSIEASNTLLKNQLRNLEILNSELELKLKNTQDELQELHKQHTLILENEKQKNEEEILTIVTSHKENLNEMKLLVEERDNNILSLKEEITKLNQEIVDQIEEKRNHEKRGSVALRDLKRQVQSEMKRANKLQEKMQEILGDSRGRSSVDELFRPIDTKDSQKYADTSSLSSWSPSGHSKDNLPQGSEEDQQGQMIRRENEALIRHSADLQLKISTFKEKVAHLEEANAMMAEDLIAKKSIIDHYIMDSRAGQSTGTNDKLIFKRVFDFVIEKSDDNTKDINKKLQNVLEETLTKNMHLQNDLDSMAKLLSQQTK